MRLAQGVGGGSGSTSLRTPESTCKDVRYKREEGNHEVSFQKGLNIKGATLTS